MKLKVSNPFLLCQILSVSNLLCFFLHNFQAKITTLCYNFWNLTKKIVHHPEHQKSIWGKSIIETFVSFFFNFEMHLQALSPTTTGMISNALIDNDAVQTKTETLNMMFLASIIRHIQCILKNFTKN